mmetsp:Transcript_10087/g.14121  ORF Transcript_10087/g.14121 Transcript_10087/m.14121 type:complete len:84 (-) Transcript_10087:265-516(-)
MQLWILIYLARQIIICTYLRLQLIITTINEALFLVILLLMQSAEDSAMVGFGETMVVKSTLKGSDTEEAGSHGMAVASTQVNG